MLFKERFVIGYILRLRADHLADWNCCLCSSSCVHIADVMAHWPALERNYNFHPQNEVQAMILYVYYEIYMYIVNEMTRRIVPCCLTTTSNLHLHRPPAEDCPIFSSVDSKSLAWDSLQLLE